MGDVKRCSCCHEELPITDFWKNKNSSDGLQGYCKTCGKLKTKEYYKNNPEKMRDITKRSWKKNRDKRNESDRNRMNSHYNFINSLKTKCAKCGEDRFYVLEFHHIDPTTKLFAISDGKKTHKTKEDVINEVSKCVCLCRNCHKEFHYFYGVKPDTPVDDLQKYLLKDGGENE